MKITIDYGKTGLAIEVPDRNLNAILGLRPAPPIPDPQAAVNEAIRSPIGAPPLAQLARSRRTACILVCDFTRPVPNQVLLEPALVALEKEGIPRDGITILVATGLHRASTSSEILEMLGPSVAARYCVESHDARDESAHRRVGATRSGIPALLDRRYLDADLKIATGLIEPHLMAGFSGGRKLICPGIAAVETIRHFHGVAILESPLATAGQVENNPVHELSLEIATMAGCDFILNAAIDDERRITGIFAGDLLEAWQRGVEHVRSIAEAPLAEPVDIVITSAAGYPLDSTYYQATKGLVGAIPAVRPGGAIIMAAAMQEGLGGPEFTHVLRSHRSIDDVEQTIRQPGYFSIDQWQVQELAKVCHRAHVSVYSDQMPAELLSTGFVEPAPSMEQAIADALHRCGPVASIAVIPRGPYVLPIVSHAAGGAAGMKTSLPTTAPQ